MKGEAEGEGKGLTYNKRRGGSQGTSTPGRRMYGHDRDSGRTWTRRRVGTSTARVDYNAVKRKISYSSPTTRARTGAAPANWSTDGWLTTWIPACLLGVGGATRRCSVFDVGLNVRGRDGWRCTSWYSRKCVGNRTTRAHAVPSTSRDRQGTDQAR